jgi:hypothetical protein
LKVAEPGDQDLQKHLMNKPMALLLKVWEIDKTDGTGKATGNWVSAVSPLKKSEPAPVVVGPAPAIDEDDLGF